MSIKRRLSDLELRKSRREPANHQERKCDACGAPRPPFDEEQYKTLNYDDAITYLISHFCGPCPECGQESEMGQMVDRIYGNQQAVIPVEFGDDDLNSSCE
jgi:hypothetical protein